MAPKKKVPIKPGDDERNEVTAAIEPTSEDNRFQYPLNHCKYAAIRLGTLLIHLQKVHKAINVNQEVVKAILQGRCSNWDPDAHGDLRNFQPIVTGSEMVAILKTKNIPCPLNHCDYTGRLDHVVSHLHKLHKAININTETLRAILLGLCSNWDADDREDLHNFQPVTTGSRIIVKPKKRSAKAPRSPKVKPKCPLVRCSTQSFQRQSHMLRHLRTHHRASQMTDEILTAILAGQYDDWVNWENLRDLVNFAPLIPPNFEPPDVDELERELGYEFQCPLDVCTRGFRTKNALCTHLLTEHRLSQAHDHALSAILEGRCINWKSTLPYDLRDFVPEYAKVPKSAKPVSGKGKKTKATDHSIQSLHESLDSSLEPNLESPAIEPAGLDVNLDPFRKHSPVITNLAKFESTTINVLRDITPNDALERMGTILDQPRLRNIETRVVCDFEKRIVFLEAEQMIPLNENSPDEDEDESSPNEDEDEDEYEKVLTTRIPFYAMEQSELYDESLYGRVAETFKNICERLPANPSQVPEFILHNMKTAAIYHVDGPSKWLEHFGALSEGFQFQANAEGSGQVGVLWTCQDPETGENQSSSLSVPLEDISLSSGRHGMEFEAVDIPLSLATATDAVREKFLRGANLMLMLKVMFHGSLETAEDCETKMAEIVKRHTGGRNGPYSGEQLWDFQRQLKASSKKGRKHHTTEFVPSDAIDQNMHFLPGINIWSWSTARCISTAETYLYHFMQDIVIREACRLTCKEADRANSLILAGDPPTPFPDPYDPEIDPRLIWRVCNLCLFADRSDILYSLGNEPIYSNCQKSKPASRWGNRKRTTTFKQRLRRLIKRDIRKLAKLGHPEYNVDDVLHRILEELEPSISRDEEGIIISMEDTYFERHLPQSQTGILDQWGKRNTMFLATSDAIWRLSLDDNGMLCYHMYGGRVAIVAHSDNTFKFWYPPAIYAVVAMTRHAKSPEDLDRASRYMINLVIVHKEFKHNRRLRLGSKVSKRYLDQQIETLRTLNPNAKRHVPPFKMWHLYPGQSLSTDLNYMPHYYHYFMAQTRAIIALPQYVLFKGRDDVWLWNGVFYPFSRKAPVKAYTWKSNDRWFSTRTDRQAKYCNKHYDQNTLPEVNMQVVMRRHLDMLVPCGFEADGRICYIARNAAGNELWPIEGTPYSASLSHEIHNQEQGTGYLCRRPTDQVLHWDGKKCNTFWESQVTNYKKWAFNSVEYPQGFAELDLLRTGPEMKRFWDLDATRLDIDPFQEPVKDDEDYEYEDEVSDDDFWEDAELDVGDDFSSDDASDSDANDYSDQSVLSKASKTPQAAKATHAAKASEAPKIPEAPKATQQVSARSVGEYPGMVNHGSTCYVSAAVHILRHLNPLAIAFLINDLPTKENNSTKFKLLAEAWGPGKLQRVLSMTEALKNLVLSLDPRIGATNASSVQFRQACNNLDKEILIILNENRSPRWRVNMMEDMCEFLEFVFTHLGELFDNSPKSNIDAVKLREDGKYLSWKNDFEKWKNAWTDNWRDSELLKSTMIMRCVERKCSTYNNTSRSFEVEAIPFLIGFPPEPPLATTLIDLLRNNFATESVEKRCDIDESHNHSRTIPSLALLPKNLIISLNRKLLSISDRAEDQRWNETRVPTEEFLDVKELMHHNAPHQSTIYQLLVIARFHGRTKHYQAFVRNSQVKGGWLRYDDSRVTEESPFDQNSQKSSGLDFAMLYTQLPLGSEVTPIGSILKTAQNMSQESQKQIEQHVSKGSVTGEDMDFEYDPESDTDMENIIDQNLIAGQSLSPMALSKAPAFKKGVEAKKIMANDFEAGQILTSIWSSNEAPTFKKGVDTIQELEVVRILASLKDSNKATLLENSIATGQKHAQVHNQPKSAVFSNVPTTLTSEISRTLSTLLRQTNEDRMDSDKRYDQERIATEEQITYMRENLEKQISDTRASMEKQFSEMRANMEKQFSEMRAATEKRNRTERAISDEKSSQNAVLVENLLGKIDVLLNQKDPVVSDLTSPNRKQKPLSDDSQRSTPSLMEIKSPVVATSSKPLKTSLFTASPTPAHTPTFKFTQYFAGSPVQTPDQERDLSDPKDFAGSPFQTPEKEGHFINPKDFRNLSPRTKSSKSAIFGHPHGILRRTSRISSSSKGNISSLRRGTAREWLPKYEMPPLIQTVRGFDVSNVRGEARRTERPPRPSIFGFFGENNLEDTIQGEEMVDPMVTEDEEEEEVL